MDGRAFVLDSDCGTLIHKVSTTITQARKRWHIAAAAIYSFRAFLSLANNTSLSIGYQQPYTVLDVEPNSPVTPSSSCIDAAKLAEIVREKRVESLHTLGGVQKIASALKTNETSGISGSENDLGWRKEKFGSNTYKRPRPKGFLYFVWNAFKDLTLIILLVCATLSLGFGIKLHGIKEGWYEGGSIFLAVFLVVIVTAVSNIKQDRQFSKLSKISDNIMISVVRDGRPQQVSIFDIVVGDVVILKIGDQIPADGLFVDGQSLLIDESSMTGESDHIEVNHTNNPFLHSGAKVGDGYGRMLVTSVGMNTSWGEMMSTINRDTNEQTPLQVRLDALTSAIGKIGLIVALLVLVVLLVRYFTGNTRGEDGQKEYIGSKTGINSILSSIVRIISAAVTIVVVAIPEGLPLAVTLTLAYSMKRMMVDQAMVRKLSACETMGSATVICTDKTGTLTLNQMQVTKAWIGEEEGTRVTAPSVLELLQQGVALNTTGVVYIPYQGGVPEISGSPTEKAILSWAIKELGMDMETIKQSSSILQVESFNSNKKRSGVMMRKESDGSINVHWKGAAEFILAMCSHYYTSAGIKKVMDEDGRRSIGLIIEGMAASSLRCIAFAHSEVSEEEVEYDEETAKPKLKEEALTLLGIVGLKDPCRPEVKHAVDVCKRAGVRIKMITGDNIFTAKAIAAECGILGYQQQEGEVVEGIEFRNYTHEERMERVDKISVMARSSPLDKLLMVQCLKQRGEVVAVTGDGTNDAPALKEADIGLAMGIQGTEVAKESSDIIILDDNFSTVATVLRWGRCVYNNIQKFIQFQLTVNVAALVINFIAAVSAGEVPLTAVQLLWVNLIMDTLGALALATERPTKELLDKPPVGRTAPLITNIMWRNLLCQSLYQISVLLILQFRGKSIFNVSTDKKNTLIFNTFVLCQVFNEFNSRRMEKQNIFEGIHKTPLFLGIVAIEIILQAVMVEFLKNFANTVSLNWKEWAACIIISFFSWPIAFLVKLIPVPEEPIFTTLVKTIAKARKSIHRDAGLETRSIRKVL
ncbi:calcium-transporting ATPase 12, plasma membrane-type-like [Chenopodium quinoa]|uniref:calcium-transporting ATPase 12, plasma membrane-type-like n=1 Tax=Chenopodium quinoa TaxID=63459 RepID=UPI000B77FCA4|nr:calcium-transporting ATPase 12, plasma membrane-type-like [Chenopodium quinoa]